MFSIEPEVIYTSPDFLALNKPAGILMYSVKSKVKSEKGEGEEPTLVQWLVRHYPEVKNVGDDPEIRPGLVHRLDRDTSGIILVARTRVSFQYLKSLFQHRAVKKTYLALVYGYPRIASGLIDQPISLRTGSTRRTVRPGRLTKEAVTAYRLKKKFLYQGERFALLELSPQTGRTHQIRVHLQSIGHPLVGDHLYSEKRKTALPPGVIRRLMLHALALEFTARQGERLRLEAEPPADWQKVMDFLEPNED